MFLFHFFYIFSFDFLVDNYECHLDILWICNTVYISIYGRGIFFGPLVVGLENKHNLTMTKIMGFVFC